MRVGDRVRIAHHCCLSEKDRTYQGTVQGSALREAPTAVSVMGCLLSDYVSDYLSCEDWCGDLGYDPDSRKALKIFKLCQKFSRALDAFLGNDILVELQECDPE